MTQSTEVTVSENAEMTRYEAAAGADVVAGFAEYRDRDGVRVFTHTEVDDAFSGQGVASTLVRGAVHDVRERGLRLHAECPFIKGWLDKHPEYADLQA